MSKQTLILASTSSYRRELLTRLQLPFSCMSPGVDETPFNQEHPTNLAQRLALAKAQAIGLQHPDAWVIGSDQVAHFNDLKFGKPGNKDAAIRQLLQLSGQTVVFDTALALVQQASGFSRVTVVPTRVQFRTLSETEILRYVEAEPAFDCAGAAKSEGLGISLLDAMHGEDPTALVGLPLIALSRMLREAGFNLP